MHVLVVLTQDEGCSRVYVQQLANLFQGQVVTGSFSLKQATSCSCAFPCSQIVTQGQGRVRVQQLALRLQSPVVTLKQATSVTFTFRS